VEGPLGLGAATQLHVEAVGKVLSNVCLYKNEVAGALILQRLAVFCMEILAWGLFLQTRYVPKALVYCMNKKMHENKINRESK